MYQQPQDGQPYYPPPPQNGQQYYPPPPSGQYNAPPSQYNAPQYSNNGYSHDGQNLESQNYQPPPPAQLDNQQPYTGGPEKIKPASGWNDVWATVLWLLNLGAFIGLAVVGLRTYKDNKGSYNGVQSNNEVSGLTFDTATFKIFGLSAVVGFGISFLYLILANM